ncbi:hypothetical protein NDU88_002790 [Pleurodeles waltl]|uniref:Uncharacterized protein n=1 Tax=Pleurodeles waltl TaxID=8319 RepID=A0AAV7L4H3_PLEWA|nr:hypothetical protein NDU88_002790 [Pleurodeles waltl]
MEAGFVEEALAHRAAQEVAAAVLACSPPHSPGRVEKVRSPGRATGWGHERAKVAGAGRAAFKAAGLRRWIGVLPHAQKGGAGVARARSARKKGRGRPLRLRGVAPPARPRSGF